MAMAYHHRHGMDVRIARLFNTYGPRLRLDDGRVIPNFIGEVLRGEPITVYGDGRQTRSFCYVDDTIEGVWRLPVAHADEGPVNLGNPAERSVNDHADPLQPVAGRPVDLDHP